MTVKKFIIPLVVLVWSFAACKKLDLAPSDRYTELTFWQVDDNVNNALNNIYSGIYNSNRYFYNEALSDNAYTRLGISAGNVDAISAGTFTIDLDRFASDWIFYYAGIKSCNIFLANVDKNTTLPAATRERMKAETRFVRAWHHFNLAKWWGDVPLLKEDITPDQAKALTRTPHAEVIKFVTDELDAAAAALPTRDQYANTDRGRITKGAALALKARVLLYEGGHMDEVVAICEQLMNNQTQNGTYSLFNNYESLFKSTKYNPEVILDLEYVLNSRMWGEYVDFAPITVGARGNNLAPTQELVNSYIMMNGKAIADAGSGYDEAHPYDNRDPRLTATVVYHKFTWKNPNGSTQTIYIEPGSDPSQPGTNEYKTSGQGTASGYYWRKYFDSLSVPTLQFGSNLILIRYAEVLLMYAEAKNSLGQMTADVWDKTIGALRQRAGFTDPAALGFPGGAADLTAIIRNERRSEFAFEGGIRTDDIRRWKIAENVMNGWAHGARYGDPATDNGYIRMQLRTFDKNKHYLWPVPSSEIARDPKLGQNPNYQ
ncbi:RagB/SusD family nutrient uptake outer membrane protein [Flavitalea sp. BT771]|uniref:RagB/SusD family nutrient uptake outer membrane protein n=1 Tax=Flavitalea sp. BT771 TaxID=3063329 RepID=UPI0026E23609|nr:RagB/SusD family nutrient uptake outer membrane protein [Flavitalea sp. BT771]MDO6429265.1 RagB/SusD family nutrient uptake outer membrane protein [Flavitalea sp. BT771]MDV6218607.1 RagB/SusD family nutrient uptake outer membrane protein [Flavitalea sp. BT771]